MHRFAAACLFILACFPALAGELDFAKDGIIHEIDLDLWPDSLSPAPAHFFTELSTAGGRFALAAKPLSDIQDMFGGTMQSAESTGYRYQWLCYLAAGQRVWFFEDDEVVDWVVAEPSNPKTDADYGCTAQPLAALTSDAFPAIGATLGDLAAQFDWPLEPNTDRVVYFSQLDDGSLTRTVYYRLKDGIVDGVSFAQWRADR